MLKLMTGLWIGWCMLAAPAAYADTGISDDTGTAEDTGDADDTGDTGDASDTAASSAGSSSGPTYGAAELAGDSGNCATVGAAPAAWMLGCIVLVLVRRRIR